MNKLESFRFGNIRRRKLTAVLAIIAAIIVLSALSLVLLGVFSFRSELVSVALTDQKENVGYNGVGINLDYIPNVNLIRNPSFEKESSYYNLSVLASDDNSIFFAPDEVIESGINTSEAIGAPIRIVSIDASGNMLLKYEGKIAGFESARLGQVAEVELPVQLNSNLDIIKTCTHQNTVTALTRSGLILADMTSEQLAKDYDGGDVSFADICSDSINIYAITGAGIVFASSDGKTFTEMNESAPIGNASITACAATNNCLCVLTSDRKLYTFSSGEFHHVTLPGKIRPHFLSSTDDEIVVATEAKEIYYSAGGFVYKRVNTGEIYHTRDIESISCSKNTIYVLNSDSSITVVDLKNPDEVKLLNSSSQNGQKLVNLAITDNGQIVASTEDKTAVIISDKADETVTISSEDMRVAGVFTGTGNRIIVAGEDKIYQASVLSDFKLEKSKPGDSFSLGDICFIETEKSHSSMSVAQDQNWELAPEGGVWDIYGEGTKIELTTDSYDGSNAVRLTGLTDNTHLLSQKLPGSINDNFIKDKFYRISIYVKADKEGITPEELKVWLSGKSFGNQGMTVTRIRSGYSEVSTVFVVNDIMLSDDDIRFNISFDGVCSVLIDQVYVGLDSYDSADIPASFADGIKSGSPSAIRLNNLGIGNDGFSESVFFGNSELSTGGRYTNDKGELIEVSDVRSLERSLRLVRDAESNPWFVFGSYTKQEQVNNFITYLCGSVSSEYGHLRINNGTALPWSRQFENVYIEINDTEGSFSSDIQRSSYVDFVISMITKSDYYTDIKDKIIFIDGMQYDGGIMLSSADAHATDMTIDLRTESQNREKTYLERISQVFEEAQTKAPRVTAGGDMGEFISSLSFDSSMNFAQYLAALTCEDTFFIEMPMVNCRASFQASRFGDDNVFAKGKEMRILLDLMSLLKGLKKTDRMFVNVTDPMSDESDQSAEKFLKGCSVSQFDTEHESYLILTNNSYNLQQFVMYNGAKSYDKSAVRRYSTEGKIMNTQRLTNSYRRYNLQPGESIIVTINR